MEEGQRGGERRMRVFMASATKTKVGELVGLRGGVRWGDITRRLSFQNVDFDRMTGP